MEKAIPKEVRDNLCKNVLLIMEMRGFSMRELSIRSDLSENFVSNLNNNNRKCRPYVDSINAIAEALDVELYMLFLPHEELSTVLKRSKKVVREIPKERLEFVLDIPEENYAFIVEVNRRTKSPES